jgi:spore germination protein YaaH
MDIKDYKLIKTNNGYELVVYLDHVLEEFSKELGEIPTDKKQDIQDKVKALIKKNFSNIKVITAKVVIGSLVLTTIPIERTSAHSTTYNMSYLFTGSTTTFLKHVERSNGHLSTAAPSYFEINDDGSLKITYQYNSAFVTEMHNQGIKVVPFFSNHWDKTLGRTALQNREQLSTEIANFIEKNNLDGVNVDIENVTDLDRDNYTDFVRLLREKIPIEKEVSVAVAANPGGWSKGWHGSYDYHNLAKYADYLMIMSYDESYPGGPEGHVASLPWVEKGIQYALGEGVPSSKIVLGLPFFGRYWIEGQSYGGYGISMITAEAMVEKYNGTVIFDEEAKAPKAIVTIGDNDPVFTIGSRTLGPGTYNISYENEKSIQYKVDLVHKYDLKGTGSWALGQETDRIWNNFGIWLEGHQDEKKVTTTLYEGFKDISSHWAKNDIASVKSRGWMVGISEDRFAPDKQLTRAQAATLFVRALNLQSSGANINKFLDVPEGFWAGNEILTAKEHGIMHGKSDNFFAVNEPITREEMAVILSRILKTDKMNLSTNITFEDVNRKGWSYKAISDMNALHIFNGYSEKKFGPHDHLTRAQMAALLNRIAVDISPYITIGSTGTIVQDLKSNLFDLGYLTNLTNGPFDQETEDALKLFQADNDLLQTGIASQKTLDKLSELLTNTDQGLNN